MTTLMSGTHGHDSVFLHDVRADTIETKLDTEETNDKQSVMLEIGKATIFLIGADHESAVDIAVGILNSIERGLYQNKDELISDEGYVI